MQRIRLLIIAMLCAVAQAGFAWSGSGTSSDPYLIASTDDWNTFASDVRGGTSYSGTYFKLTADIITTSYAGSGGKSFSGTFDGDGHTLTFNYDNTSEFIGVFCYVNGATIKNLKTAGTITTSAKFAGGIVGEVRGGTNTITNCVSSVTINSSINGDGTHGGLVGIADYGTTNIEGCVFNGKFIGTSTLGWGGFVGWTEGNQGAKVTLKNCIFDPMTFETSGDGKTFARYRNSSDVSLTNCFYSQTFGDDQGKKAYGITAGDYMTTMTNAGSISGEYNVTNAIFYNVGFKYNDVLYGASGENVKLTLYYTMPDGYTFEKYLTTQGSLSGEEHSYTLTMTSSNARVSAQAWNGNGTGTKDDPYLIATADNWDAFATNVKNNAKYSGKYLKMTGDVSVSTYAGGGGGQYAFYGNFDGDGHTIDVNYNNTTNYIAPFCYVNGATIKNVKTTGTINTSAKYAGGIVADVEGSGTTTTLTNCVSSVTINSTVDGDGTHGGLVAGVAEGVTLNMEGCVFNGKLLGETTNKCGGMVGYTNGGASLTFKNCFYAPTEVTVSTDGCATFSRGQAPTVTNGYYTQTLGDAQGSQVYQISKGDYVSSLTIGENIDSRYDGYDEEPRRDDDWDFGDLIIYVHGLHFEGNYYAQGSEQVQLDLEYEFDNDSYTFAGYAVTGGSISYNNDSYYTKRYTLTMPGSADVTISAGFWTGNGTGTEDDPFLVQNADDWNIFAKNINNGNTYEGQYFQLANDISVTKYAGRNGRTFNGTFDGNGKTITVDYDITSSYIAPFVYVKGATIKNLKTSGTIKTSAKFAGGIVADVKGSGATTTLTNCASDVTIDSSIDGDGSHGGLVGGVDSGAGLTIEGCVFNGKLLGEKTTNCGGFIGWANNSSSNPSTVTISQSLFTPSEVTFSTSVCGTFNRGQSPTLTNCYYTQPLGTAQGTQVYSITAGDYITTLENAGTVNDGQDYDVSGLKLYDVGIQFVDVYYAANGEEVSLNLAHNVATGYAFTGYITSCGSVSGWESPLR